MCEVHAGHELEQLSRDMLRAADAGRGHVELAGIGLGVGDELGDGLDRHRGVDLHDQRNALDLPDRRDVADKVEAELLVERDVDCVLRVDQQQRVAVGRHVGHGFGCDVAGGTRPDLDEELLAELLRQELRDQTRDDVGRAARRLADDDFHRTRGIGLRADGSRKRRSTRGQSQELSTG